MNTYLGQHSALVGKWIRKGWGLGRLYRHLAKLYPLQGKSVVLSFVLRIAAQEGVLYRTEALNRVLREERFTVAERNAIRKWARGLEDGRRYVTLKGEKQRRLDKQENDE